MLFEKYYKEWVEKWDIAMANSEHFSMDKRDKEAKKKQWDNSSKGYDQTIGSYQPRIDAVMDILEKKGVFQKPCKVLDIGSGTGSYTLALAPRVEVVHALDSSEGMNNKLKEKIKNMGIKNVEILEKDWKALNLQEEGMIGQYDIVIASLNPALYNAGDIEKMMLASKGICIYIASAGFSKNERVQELNQLVFGRSLERGGGNDVIHPFNILYSLGYYPEMSYVDCIWRKRYTTATAIEVNKNKYSGYLEITDAIEEVIVNYINKHSKDGYYTETFENKLGIITWNARNNGN